jgi:hypothetical protein
LHDIGILKVVEGAKVVHTPWLHGDNLDPPIAFI